MSTETGHKILDHVGGRHTWYVEVEERLDALEERMTAVVMQMETLQNLLTKLVKLLEGAIDGEQK